MIAAISIHARVRDPQIRNGYASSNSSAAWVATLTSQKCCASPSVIAVWENSVLFSATQTASPLHHNSPRSFWTAVKKKTRAICQRTSIRQARALGPVGQRPMGAMQTTSSRLAISRSTP